MTNFKEYLNQKTLNENIDDDYENIKKDPVKNLILKWINKHGKNERFFGLNSNGKKNVLDELNKEIEDKKLGNKYNDVKELSGDFENIEKIVLNKSFNSFGDIDKANDKDFKDLFFQAILNEKDNIAKLDGNIVRQVANCFSSSNKNGNKEIDKEEFINAIKKIQSKFKDLTVPATILWLLYLKQNAIEKDIKIFNNNSSELPSGSETIAHLKDKDDFYVKGKELTSNFEDLNLVFKSFENLQIDKSVLKNFKNIKSSKSFLNKNIDELGDKIKGNFTEKSKEAKEQEQQEAEQALQAEKDAEAKDNSFIQKKKWYIFDTVPPETEEDDIEGFFSSIKGECKKILNDIVEKMDEYTPKDRSKNLKEPVEESIVNKYLKNTITEERLETYKKYFDGLKEDLEEEKNNLEREIEEILADLSGKVKDLAEILKNETNYKNKVKNQVKFRQLFIDYGYTITKKIQKFTKDAAEVLKKVKILKHFDNQKDEITPEQQKTNELDIKRISDMLLKANEIDHYNIARFMLINLLHTNNNSEQVLDKLKEKDFKNMKGFVYVGNSNKVFAFDKRKIKKNIIGDYTFYDFEQTSAESYKNPSSLMLAAFGIDVNTLTTEVLKGLRERTVSLKKQAEDYLAKANELVRIFSNISKTASSVVTEGLFGLGSKEDTEVKNYLSDVKKIDDTKDTNKEIENLLNIAAREIKLPDGYEPTDNGADDLALRQFLKGYSLIVSKNGKKYVTTIENSKKIKEMIKNKNAEIKSKNAENGTQINDQATQNAVKFNSDATSGQVYDSVVTSSAADSTYGDGYGYNKKADAIKKKLNCTTYTYSPNPKMKIVRRTFD